MDAKTLSVILGHYSVSFTLDTYAHVLNDHKREGMALMDELFHTEVQEEKSYSYPVIITTQENGDLYFMLPDFPEFSFTGSDFRGGIQYVKEYLSEAVLTVPYPPEPTIISNANLAEGQIVLQIPV